MKYSETTDKLIESLRDEAREQMKKYNPQYGMSSKESIENCTLYKLAFRTVFLLLDIDYLYRTLDDEVSKRRLKRVIESSESLFKLISKFEI